MWRSARPWAALFFCLLTGCLSDRTGSDGLTSNEGPWPGLWRGQVPHSNPAVEAIPTSRVEKTGSPPRQPQVETLLILAQRCYETAGDAARDPEQRYEHYQRALQTYLQVLRQDPNNQLAQLGLARVRKKQGQLDQAIADLKKLLERSPRFAAAWYELGMCYGARQDWAEQVRCLNQACQLEPHNTHYATHLGLALARAQRWGEAELQLTQAVGSARAAYYLALMAEHVNRHDLFVHYARAAVQADPNMRHHPRLQQLLTGTAATQSAQR